MAGNRMHGDRTLLAWLIVLLPIGLGIAAFLYWPSSHRDLPERPPLTAENLGALADAEVVSRTFDHLRWFLWLNDKRVAAWHTLPEAARHVLVLSDVETDNGLPQRNPFPGLQSVRDGTCGLAIPLADLAAAYRAINANQCADVVTEADAVPIDATDGNTLLAACDRRLIAASRKEGTVRLMLNFVRAHADELASTWAKP